MIYELEVDNIRVTVSKKRIKNMYLKVLSPKGEVKISAPLSASDSHIKEFIKSKSEWIKSKQMEIRNNTENINITDKKYMNNETHYLWGKPYKLQLIKKNKKFNHIVYDENTIYLPVNPDNTSIEKRKKAMTEFYRKEIKSEIPGILNECIDIVGKSPEEWRVKNMKTRWGTCNTRKKRIWLNLQLAKMSPECLKHVIIHELTHLHVPNHGSEFKDYMNKFDPDWKETEKLMKKEKYY